MARRLLTLGAMTTLTASCVLPPPPPDDSDATPTLTVASQLATPTESKVGIQRDPAATKTFSVENALRVPVGFDIPNVYWYVGYELAPFQEPDRGLNFTLNGCDNRITNTTASTNTFSVEALVTYGEIVLLTSGEGDRRVTREGEDIFAVRWALEALGDGTTCGAPQ